MDYGGTLDYGKKAMYTFTISKIEYVNKMTISPLTGQFLEGEVASARAQVESIGNQIEQMKAQREAMKLKAEALAALLSKHKIPSEAPTPDAPPVPPIDDNSVKGLGFREAIRKILKDADHGLRTGDIADELLQRGFEYSASTKLSTRISNDLSKMIQSQMVRKRGPRYYLNRSKGEK